MKIAVYGSAAGDIEASKEKAREAGREIARKRHILITGACPGLPYEAALGAKEEGGTVVGFSPGLDLDDHVERFGFPTDVFNGLIYVPQNYHHRSSKGACLKYRNISSVVGSEAAIFISGRCGTLNEFTLAYDLGKKIGVLVETGGMTDYFKKLVEVWDKPSSSQIIYSKEPRDLIAELESITN